MRAILLILILVVVAAIVALATGFLHLNQTQGAQAPNVAVGDNGVTTKGGQAPAFKVETGSVSVGTQTRDVSLPEVQLPVPSLKVNRPAEQNAAQNGQQPANSTAQ